MAGGGRGREDPLEEGGSTQGHRPAPVTTKPYRPPTQATHSLIPTPTPCTKATLTQHSTYTSVPVPTRPHSHAFCPHPLPPSGHPLPSSPNPCFYGRERVSPTGLLSAAPQKACPGLPTHRRGPGFLTPRACASAASTSPGNTAWQRRPQRGPRADRSCSS